MFYFFLSEKSHWGTKLTEDYKCWYCSYKMNKSTWCEELTHWKRPWWWEGLGTGGEGDDRGWDGWMVSPTPWIWVWVNSRSWWWTGRPGMLWFRGSQRVRHDWAIELNWTEWPGNKSFSNSNVYSSLLS